MILNYSQMGITVILNYSHLSRNCVSWIDEGELSKVNGGGWIFPVLLDTTFLSSLVINLFFQFSSPKNSNSFFYSDFPERSPNDIRSEPQSATHWIIVLMVWVTVWVGAWQSLSWGIAESELGHGRVWDGAWQSLRWGMAESELGHGRYVYTVKLG